MPGQRDNSETPPPTLEALAALAAIELPGACEQGVRDNLALLASHWRNLEGFAIPGDAEHPE
ncbi:hypothetical protein ACFQ1E_15485 [Sphingomonas canadensis]|uniref:Uncharacterized protein n=1 Tax=Sphingomonas canadensis TaxID=1219257 RepID=A0ABW3H8D5_9SPHN|nr:hypothetical protein [Sphingomonas canadensis]MCW3837395.1 hypothetical protein [Sphingomonas canadensis]